MSRAQLIFVRAGRVTPTGATISENYMTNTIKRSREHRVTDPQTPQPPPKPGNPISPHMPAMTHEVSRMSGEKCVWMCSMSLVESYVSAQRAVTSAYREDLNHPVQRQTELKAPCALV